MKRNQIYIIGGVLGAVGIASYLAVNQTMGVGNKATKASDYTPGQSDSSGTPLPGTNTLSALVNPEYIHPTPPKAGAGYWYDHHTYVFVNSISGFGAQLWKELNEGWEFFSTAKGHLTSVLYNTLLGRKVAEKGDMIQVEISLLKNSAYQPYRFWVNSSSVALRTAKQKNEALKFGSRILPESAAKDIIKNY